MGGCVEMEIIPSVILKSSSGCVIGMGGSLRELLPNVPVLAPLDIDGRLLFTIWGPPGDAGYIPAAHGISVSNGGVSSTLPVTDWDGAYEVRVEPLACRPYSFVPPKLLDSADYYYKQERAKVELYLDGGLRIAVTPASGGAFSVPVGEGRGGRLRTLDMGRDKVLTVLAEKENGMRLVILDRAAETLLDVEGDKAEISDGMPAVIRRLPSVRGFERRIRYELTGNGFTQSSEETGFFTAEEHTPEGEGEIALAFFQELKLGEHEMAMEYLSNELKEAASANELKAFIGDYEEAALYPFEEPLGCVTVGLLSEGAAVRKARKFRLRFEYSLITDVEEL